MNNNTLLDNTYEQPLNNPTLQTPPKTHGRIRPAVAGAVGALAGLIVGAAGIYGIIKMTEQPPTCPGCKCPRVTSGISDLDYSFLKLESSDSNIIYSPLSIKNGLVLLDAGANGNTKTEIENVLGNEEIPKYQNIPEKLSLANAVFIKDTFKDKVLPTYTDMVQNNLGGEILFDPFESIANMDNWVDQKTFGLIKDIGIEITPNLEMALTNALAIQMDWKYKFDDEKTHGGSFYTKDDNEIKATTMMEATSNEEVKYYIDEKTTAVSMPLDSTIDNVNLDFIAIMPSNRIDEYINSLDSSTISNVISSFTSASVPQDGIVINIPKFKFDYQLKFREDLEALGIQTAFDKDTADFSNMASEPLYVEQAVHKANIDFSEDGTKAAAITVFGMASKSAAERKISEPISINIDHPFLFLIRDANNGTIWFTGTVYQPNLWADDQEAYQISH